MQDPESVDVLQDTGFKKDGSSGLEGGAVSKSRKPKTAESNFVSFVTDPDSEMQEKTKSVISLSQSQSLSLSLSFSLSLNLFSFLFPCVDG